MGRRRWIWAGVAGAALSAGLWALLASEEPTGGPRESDPLSAEARPEAHPAAGGEKSEDSPAIAESPSAQLSPRQRERRRRRRALRRATRAYRSYVAAIGERDGEAVCALIEPGFLDELRPTVRRGSCGERIAASIGFADPRGFPVWAGTRFSGVETARVRGDRVQLSAAIVTRFADREEPSVESDIAYLLPGPDGYRLATASGALWRAVGKPDVPPQVVAPPPGFSD